jgi:hypothetical protein
LAFVRLDEVALVLLQSGLEMRVNLADHTVELFVVLLVGKELLRKLGLNNECLLLFTVYA